MKLAASIVLLLASLACDARSGPDVIAVFRGGEITLSDIEDVVSLIPYEQRFEQEVEIERWYREIAEDIALRRWLNPTIEKANFDPKAWREANPGKYRHMVIQHFLNQEKRDDLLYRPSDQQVSAFYENHRDEYYQPKTRQLFHIFRRFRDDQPEGETLEFLDRLRERVKRGDSFEALARAHSDSENRQMGGSLGWVKQGDLEPQIENEVFALASGEVSAPIRVPGGAALFLVKTVINEKQYSLEDVQQTIRIALRQLHIDKTLREAAASIDRPDGATVLSASEFAAAISTAEPNQVLFRFPDFLFTKGDFLKTLAAVHSETGKPTMPQAYLFYERMVFEQHIYLKAVDGGFVEDSGVQKWLLERIAEVNERQKLAQRIEQLMEARLDGLDGELRAFYEENRSRFQSPLRFHLKRIVVDAIYDPNRQYKELIEISEELENGLVTLEQAAARVDGRLINEGWKQLEDFPDHETKIKVLLAEMRTPGFTVPFQLNNSMQIIEMVERQEPLSLSFAEAENKVRRLYLEHHGTQLYQEVRQKILTQAEFRYFPDRIRYALEAPGPLSG